MTNPLNTWLQERNTERQLRQLSDRDLSDIGIVRGNIKKAARNAVRFGKFDV